MTLPSGYQEVEYIEASGTQYIESGYIPNGNTKIASKFACTNNTTSNCTLFGAANSSDNNEYVLRTTTTTVSDNNGHALFSAAASWSGTSYAKDLPQITPGDIIEFEYDKTGGKYGSTTWTWNLSGSSAGANMLILGFRRRGTIDGRNFIGKLYYFKIRDNGTLVRDFIPCYRKSDDEIGLYDLVNDTFYTNQGTGTFTKGPNVVPVPTYKLHGAIQTFHYQFEVPYSWGPDASRTLLYLPLESNATDYSGNSRSTTPSNITYASLGGIMCANANGSSSKISVDSQFLSQSMTAGTICVFMYTQSKAYSDTYPKLIEFAKQYSHYVSCGVNNNNDMWVMTNGQTRPSGGLPGLNQRIHLILTFDTNGYEIYQDGVLVGQGSQATPVWGSYTASYEQGQRIFCNRSGSNNYWKGGAREIVFENIRWSAEDASKYYQRIKNKLGL